MGAHTRADAHGSTHDQQLPYVPCQSTAIADSDADKRRTALLCTDTVNYATAADWQLSTVLATVLCGNRNQQQYVRAGACSNLMRITSQCQRIDRTH